MAEYSWRPAALRREARVTLGPQGLVRDGGAALPWAAVTGLGFALDETRQVTMMTFRVAAGPRVETLSVTGRGPEAARYVAMLRAVVAALAAARPDLAVTLGHVGGARRGMAAMGALMALAGLGLAGLGLALGLGRDPGGGAGLGLTGLLVAVMGGATGWANRPGAPRQQVPLAAFLAELDRGLGRPPAPAAAGPAGPPGRGPDLPDS